MKKHRDLVLFLKSHGLRMTASKKLMIQFFLDHQNHPVRPQDLQSFMTKHLPKADRTTIYRNIEKLISLDVIQELHIPQKGKVFKYIFDKKPHHYCICKSCGKVIKGNEDLFKRIEKTLKEIHDFAKANLSVVFYGHCSQCE
ncbi:Fur family transcriptional regulator [Bdellovibrio bacteriovorus]|uniref:Ferric uptake regulator, Fur family n=1 Tax=Bdellovibrio bacteriovorus str. Tiberius TaxID=1069642 RepID=K7YZL7_BDEBC|nr:transcriptional repressor [Bdellovibrio bacteriovorus]AFY02170.1 ferric uptake regulator, Fur family [Bdellovibrio bacteriovorus str. Tiberius]